MIRKEDDQRDEMRRLQTGTIGIVAVLLLVGLASTLGARKNDAAKGASATNASGQILAAEKSEPLVELGVQPNTQDTAKVGPPVSTGAVAGGNGTAILAPPAGATAPNILPSQPVPVRADGSVPDLKPDPKAQKAVRPN
jgi:hypothetical protein